MAQNDPLLSTTTTIKKSQRFSEIIHHCPFFETTTVSVDPRELYFSVLHHYFWNQLLSWHTRIRSVSWNSDQFGGLWTIHDAYSFYLKSGHNISANVSRLTFICITVPLQHKKRALHGAPSHAETACDLQKEPQKAYRNKSQKIRPQQYQERRSWMVKGLGGGQKFANIYFDQRYENTYGITWMVSWLFYRNYIKRPCKDFWFRPSDQRSKLFVFVQTLVKSRIWLFMFRRKMFWPMWQILKIVAVLNIESKDRLHWVRKNYSIWYAKMKKWMDLWVFMSSGHTRR